jgi:hypothetical protein
MNEVEGEGREQDVSAKGNVSLLRCIKSSNSSTWNWLFRPTLRYSRQQVCFEDK